MSGARADDEVAALKLAYEYTVQERDRLRAARAFFARQLGPLPTFAGVSVALVGAFSDRIHQRPWLWAALAVLVLLILLSVLYSGLPAYRQLRAHKEIEWRAELERTFVDAAKEAEARQLRVEDLLGEREWYIAQIGLERELIGEAGRKNRLLPPRRDPTSADLVDQLDRERTGVFVAQGLFLILIGCLLAARLL